MNWLKHDIEWKGERIWLLLPLLILFAACTNSSEIATADIVRNVGPDETIDNFTVVSTIGERQEWLMIADLVKRFNEERRWVAYNVFMETLNEEDKNFYRSDSVFVSDITNILTGMGNVKITTPSGILKTDLIHWNRMSDRIHAPNDVYLTRDSHEIWGSDLRTDSNLGFIDMRNVTGHGTLIMEDL
jgi:LPS export ABC transporter protein LptC